MTDLFSLAVMQAKSLWIGSTNKARQTIRENTRTHLRMLDMLPFGAHPGAEFPKIVVYPEFSLQGVPLTKWNKDVWLRWLREVAVELPGEVTDAFAKKSVENNCYIQVCVWDADKKLGPDTFFESVFITDPKGKVAYIRRRASLGIAGPVVTPDVFDEFVKKYGPDPVDALFPVLKTPYGVLGGIMCCEMSTPEISRALSMNGAEVLLHSTSEPRMNMGTGIQGTYLRDFERPVRAADNCVYLASANIGETNGVGAPVPQFRDRGCSEILDWRGNRITRLEGIGESIGVGLIDIDALRRVRRRWLFGHLVPNAYAPVYQRQGWWPLNNPAKNEETAKEARRKVESSLIKRAAIQP
ncbi:MAG: hypothetical protein JRN20_08430 [Nitrososphaerota archaeon]|nr:hypothetical protein [Nitrososphaerota archaeon]